MSVFFAAHALRQWGAPEGRLVTLADAFVFAIVGWLALGRTTRGAD
jgi:hypothetical protein